MTIASTRRTLAQALVMSWFIVAMYLQHDLGLADNGDFTRSMTWVTSGPVGIAVNAPAAGTADWSRRFYNEWIPFWKLEWHVVRPETSAVVLWLPGALANTWLYSRSVLSLPVLSLFPKLMLFAMLWLLCEWMKRDTRYTTMLLFSLGAPVVLIVTTTDYVAYLNSFYRESASLVFVVCLFVSLLRLLEHRSSVAHLLWCLICILLTATVRPANLYWPLVVIPFVLAVWSGGKAIRVRTTIGAALALVMVLTGASALITNVGSIAANPYHSVFYGVLVFSDDPSGRLRELAMDDGGSCIHASAFSSLGSVCLAKYRDRLSFQTTARAIAREPLIMWRMLKYVLDNMQDLSLNFLGKYPPGDPRSRTAPQVGLEERVWISSDDTTPLNLWAAVKFTLFPTGYTLAGVLLGFAVWFVSSLKGRDVHQEVALVGLMLTVACVVDMTVAILGDGKYELIKHLFLSNLLFDLAAVVFLNSVLLYARERPWARCALR